jgi:hypothetical protein
MYHAKETVRKTLEMKLEQAQKFSAPLALKGEQVSHTVDSFLSALEYHFGKKG